MAAGLDFRLYVDTSGAKRILNDLQRKQLPYAMSLALNKSAFTAMAAERAAIGSGAIFEHPRPFTKKSVLVTKSTKVSLSTTIFIRPEVARYLAPYEFGGNHFISGPSGKLLVPIVSRDLAKALGIKVDSFGQYTQDARKKLNQLADDPDSGVTFGNVNTKDGIVRGYWLNRRLQKKPPGTPRAKRGQAVPRPKLVLLAAIEPNEPVKQHLDFVSNVTKHVEMAWQTEFEQALDKALRTAR